MITALISFFGGSVFRVIWGEVAAWITARQDHRQEIERMRLQGELEAAQHARNQEAIKTQAALGVQTIQVQAEADLGHLDAAAFGTAVELTGRATGIRFVDGWNGIIRPGLATVSIVLVVADAWKWVTLNENAWGLAGAALGIYVADRTLFRRGK